jgi:hypothetical protein
MPSAAFLPLVAFGILKTATAGLGRICAARGKGEEISGGDVSTPRATRGGRGSASRRAHARESVATAPRPARLHRMSNTLHGDGVRSRRGARVKTMARPEVDTVGPSHASSG